MKCCSCEKEITDNSQLIFCTECSEYEYHTDKKRKTMLYPCGSQVTIKIANIKGIITGQLNRFGYIEYEISYFADGIHYAIWMHESEFSTDEKKKMGFL